MTPFHKLALSVLVAGAALPACAGEVRLNGHVFTLPDGLTVERVPGTEIVPRPVSASFDDQGALYVTDSAGVNIPPSEQLKNPQNRILKLIDADGDGRFESSTVYADRVMFPQGCLWHGNSVYVAAPPSIWKFTDTDGDGVSDRREEWYQGRVLTGCANDVHGPYLGPEGMLYWTKGAFERLDLKDHRGQPIRDRAAHVFRARPDGSRMEVVMSGGMDNPVEVAFLPDGEPILISTFLDLSQPGRRDGLAHAVYGGVFGKINGSLDEPIVRKTGDLLPAMTHYGPAAACALMRYEGESLGEGYAGNLFGTLFNLRKVTRHEVVNHGATYLTKDSDFLVSDQMDFRPTDVLEDIDGSLLVVDTGGWYKLCCPSSQLAKADVLGAIYRVRRDAVGRATSDMDAEKRLVRYARLVAPPSLNTADPVVELKRLSWTADPKDAPSVRKVLAEHTSAAVQGGSSARRVRVAAEALGRMRDSSSVPVLLEAVAAVGDADRFLEHSLLYALIEIGEVARLREHLGHGNASVRRAVLMALEQVEGGNPTLTEILPALRAGSPRLRETAQWVLQRHSEWGSGLSAHLRERLQAASVAVSEKSDWEGLFAMLVRSGEGRGFLAEAVTGESYRTETRLAALRAMSALGGKEVPGGWPEALALALGSEPVTVVEAAVEAARALPLPKEGNAVLTQRLRAVVAAVSVPDRIRLKAMGILPVDVETTPAEWALLRAVLDDPGRASGDRTAAAAALARFRLTEAQRLHAVGWLPGAGPLELPRLVAAFAGRGSAAIGRPWVAALSKSKGLRAVRPEDLRAVAASYPDDVKTSVEALLASLQSNDSKDRERLDGMLDELKRLQGDIRRGQAVFNGPKAACATCHRMGYLGGNFGPDLTSIGTIRTERDLLEALLYPSASFVRSYEPWIAVDHQGDEHSGILRHETADEIVMAPGPGAEVRLARSNLKEFRPAQLSVMPAGLDEQLSRQELADLLVFLKNTKWGAN